MGIFYGISIEIAKKCATIKAAKFGLCQETKECGEMLVMLVD